MKKNILVLGSDGMVGRVVFLYLQSPYPGNVWGTTREKRKVKDRKFLFNAESYKSDFASLQEEIKRVDYVINCIAVLNDFKSIKDQIYINALFPHLLEESAEKNNFNVIHLSTDAVFAESSGEVNESSPPSPADIYGMTKLLGETFSKRALTFRSSFIGIDPEKHKGILEKIMQAKGTIYGYTNQIWRGCTSLQFAQMCESIIKNNSFISLRNKSRLYHFVPLKPISKYRLIKSFMKINRLKIELKLKESNDRKINRVLTTNYFEPLFMDNYTANIDQALGDLIKLEKNKIL